MDQNNRLKAETKSYLEQKIQQLEGFKSIAHVLEKTIGLDCLDRAFPQQVFPVGVHEFLAPEQNVSSSLGFMSAILSSICEPQSSIIWITKSGNVYPPGLALFGLEPHRIIFVSLRRDREVLWALESALQCRGLGAAIGEINDADLNATKRLQLATERSGVTGFLLKLDPRYSSPSACCSSWRIEALPSHLEDGLPGVGHPRWRVRLDKIRNGTPGQWDIEWRRGALHELAEKQKPVRRFSAAISGAA